MGFVSLERTCGDDAEIVDTDVGSCVFVPWTVEPLTDS